MEKSPDVVPGVSLELSTFRKKQLSDITYQLSFDIPAQRDEVIKGEVVIKCLLEFTDFDLILDFNSPDSKVRKVELNDHEIEFERKDEHLIIAKEHLTDEVKIKINFDAGNQSLNRHEDYLFTLFVPDRASTCFPLFDQPDLKAKYKLNLTLPDSWTAVSNAHMEKEGRLFRSDWTKSISSYLFSFAAGKFEVITQEIDGRTINMYHRETDKAKVEDNYNEVFRWHSLALHWLEEYTGIEYPFEKFDFVLIPSFQYGGMEHPGSIFYKASSLFLDKSHTLNQELGRAHLIAHEVAHMWFGNLVTMKWFDDVWLKEVFANFMAAKIVHPNYPEINHDLQFLLSHYPSAYSVDRSKGSNPIQQNLDNLKNAGGLYGAVIYNKAPIVMRMLEDAVGEEKFQKDIRTYLNKYEFDNATWDDLISIFSQNVDFDLKQWDSAWVKSRFMPEVGYTLNKSDSGFVKHLKVWNKGENEEGKKQDLKVALGYGKTLELVEAPYLTHLQTTTFQGKPFPDNLFVNGNGKGYGFFRMTENSREHYLKAINTLENPVLRAALWINFYESMLRNRMKPMTLMTKMIETIPIEKDELIIEYLNRQIRTIYWKFLTDNERLELAPKLEGVLLNMAVNATNRSLKTSFFNSMMEITLTDTGLDVLLSFFEKDMIIDGLVLSEKDLTKLAYELAVREVNGYEQILKNHLAAIDNPDRKKRMEFVIPALSSKESERDEFFESLKKPENREKEEWVLEANRYLHHPLRGKQSVKYIRPSLELLEEIKLTGDIFFPNRWLSTTFSGHQSEEAVNEVRQFLYENNKYPEELRNKIFQSTDLMFRSLEVLDNANN